MADEYAFDQFPLTQGLNLYDPQSLLKAGFLCECQNWEIVSSFGGLQLAGGYEPFLGNSQPFSRYDWHYAQQTGVSPLLDASLGNALTPYATWGNTRSYIGGPLYDSGATVPKNLVGLFMGSFRVDDTVDRAYTRFQIYDKSILDNVTTTLFGQSPATLSVSHNTVNQVASSTLDVDNFPFTVTYTAGDIAPYVVAHPDDAFDTKENTALKLVDQARTAYTSMSNYAGALPQEALGLHWFENNLFAVAPVQYVSTVLTAGGPLNVVPGDFIRISMDSRFHRFAVGAGGGQTIRAAAATQGHYRVLFVDPGNAYILVQAVGTFSLVSSSATKAHPHFYLPTIRNFLLQDGWGGDVYIADSNGVTHATANFTLSLAIQANTFDATVPCGVYMCRSLEDSLAIAPEYDLSRAGWSPIESSWKVVATNVSSPDDKLVKFKSGVDLADQQTSEAPGNTTGVVGADAGDPDAAANKGNPFYLTTGHSGLPQAIEVTDPRVLGDGGLSNYRNLNSSSGADYDAVQPLGVDAGFTFPAESVGDFNDTSWVGLAALRKITLTTASPKTYYRSGVINFGGIGALDEEIPDTAAIRGIVVTVKYDIDKTPGYGIPLDDNIDFSAAGTNINANAEVLTMDLSASLTRVSEFEVRPGGSRSDTLIGTPQTVALGAGAAATNQTATFGSSTSTWGATSIKKSEIIDALQGISLQVSGSVTMNAADTTQDVMLARVVKIREVVVVVHYVLPSVRYYFYDGVDYVRGDLIDYTVLSGSLAGGDAKVILQLTNVVANDTDDPDNNRNAIKAADKIYTSAAVGTELGRVDSAMTAILLPSKNDLLAEESKYQFMDANFYGNVEQSVVYGVSGAGRGFAFDSNYLQLIYANIDDEDLDKPRHVIEYEGQLCLAYKYGALFFSDVGNPTTFTGIAGAAVVAVGQRVTGLSTLVGGTLGVFCDNSVRSISGATPDYLLKVLAPNGGAIEYTVVDIGSPVYASQAGLTTLEQTDKYGDFYGSTLSEAVNTWLLPRLTTKAAASSGSSANSRQIIAAMPNRTNAQVKLFFEDGQVLSMTFVGPNKEPKFTFQRYFINQRYVQRQTAGIVPLAFSSQIDSNGRERIHISYEGPNGEFLIGEDGSNVGNVYGHPRNVYDVVELNVGWTFHFNPILDAYFVVSANYMNNPFEYGSLKKVRLEGKHQGYDNLLAYAFSDYRTYAEFTSNPDLQDMSLFEEERREISEDYTNGSKIRDLPSHGRFFKLVVVANDQDEFGADLTPSLGVVAQSVNVQYEKGKMDA